jgi:hypothetical protein
MYPHTLYHYSEIKESNNLVLKRRTIMNAQNEMPPRRSVHLQLLYIYSLLVESARLKHYPDHEEDGPTKGKHALANIISLHRVHASFKT